MSEPDFDRRLPTGLKLGRRTPLFNAQTVPPGLLGLHHTTVWARLEVEQGSVVFIEDDPAWQTVATPEHPVVIVPERRHRIEPSPDASFAVQFFEQPEAVEHSLQSPVPSPAPTKDLDSVDEITEMVRRFYGDVAQDDRLGPIFNDVAGVDWSVHLPKLTAFWCRALLGMGRYSGNPFQKHQLVHEKRAFTPADFQRWFQLFTETIELGWSGPNADRAIELATSVARVHSKQLLGHEVEL